MWTAKFNPDEPYRGSDMEHLLKGFRVFHEWDTKGEKMLKVRQVDHHKYIKNGDTVELSSHGVLKVILKQEEF